MPSFASWSSDAATVQCPGNASDGRYARATNIIHNATKVCCTLSSICFELCDCLRISLLLATERPRAIGVSQTHPSCFRGGKSGLGVLGDCPSNCLSYGGDDVDSEPVSIRHVSRDEVDAAFLQTRDEVKISCEPVEPSNQELRSGGLRVADRCLKLWARVAFPALDFDILGQKLRWTTIEITGNRLALCFKPKPAATLLVR